jgi:hypothetical protein
MEQWLAVELWSAPGWESVGESERALPRTLLDDPRFHFIAQSEEEWAGFRRADIVVACDLKTGALSVVFSWEHVQRARDNVDELVPALVVRFNPDTDELERLAAACLFLKGRHELQSESKSSVAETTDAQRGRGRWSGEYQGEPGS